MLKLKEIKRLPKPLMEMYDSHQKTKPNLEIKSDTAVLICSDARVPIRAVSDGSLYVLENAGNVFDNQTGAIPHNIEYIFVIGHKSEPAKGCGACAAAAGLSVLPPHELIKKRGGELPHELYKVAMTAKISPEENLKHVVDSLKKWGFRGVGYAFIDNSTCELSGFSDITKTTDYRIIKAKETIEKANAHYRKNIHPHALKKVGADFLRRAQNPKIISVTNMDIPLAELFGGEYLQANKIFEAKQGVSKTGLTDITIGSAQYAFLHYNGHDDNFKTTNIAIFSSATKDSLVDMLRSVNDEDPALKRYISKGGAIYGVTLNKKEGMKFYNLVKK